MSNKEERKAPVLRFKGFTDDWEQRKLQDISERINRKNEKLESNLPLTISAQYGLVDQKNFFNKQVASKNLKNYILLKKGEFAYNKSYSKDLPYGAIKRLNLYSQGVISSLYIAFKPVNVNSNFLEQYFNSNKWYKEIYRNAAEGARNHGLLNIAPKDFFSSSLNIPSDKTEQKDISNLLFKLDKLLSLQQRKLEYYRKLKKHLSNKVFSTENYGATVTLGKIFNTVTDYVANGSFKSLRENVKTYSNKNYAYLIRLQDASNNWQGPWLYTDKKGYDFLKKSKLRPGDIIMANVGSVGKVFQVPDLSYPMTLAPNAILLRSKAANNAFLFEFLRSDYGQNLVRKMTTPGVQNKINKTDFKKITIRLPKKEIQDKWASLFESLNQIELGQLSSISNLKEIRKFLLQNMFI